MFILKSILGYAGDANLGIYQISILYTTFRLNWLNTIRLIMRGVDQASHVLSYGMPHLTHITTIDFGPLDSTHQQMPPNHPAFIMSISQQINTQHRFQGVFRPAPPAHHHEEKSLYRFESPRLFASAALGIPKVVPALFKPLFMAMASSPVEITWEVPTEFWASKKNENSSWKIPSRELL